MNKKRMERAASMCRGDHEGHERPELHLLPAQGGGPGGMLAECRDCGEWMEAPGLGWRCPKCEIAFFNSQSPEEYWLVGGTVGIDYGLVGK